jgi:WhiB family redox-sensing transcriptional regulator
MAFPPVRARTDEEWKEAAACVGTDLDFLPPRGTPLGPLLDVCETCKVREPCLEYALTMTPRAVGVWGGLSEKNRNKIRRQRRQEAA